MKRVHGNRHDHDLHMRVLCLTVKRNWADSLTGLAVVEDRWMTEGAPVNVSQSGVHTSLVLPFVIRSN